MFNKAMFKSKIVEMGSSIREVAAIMGCNEGTLYRKMDGKSDFTRNEIQLFRQAFNLGADDIERIFFCT